jgi:diamine N-acetyltransferase
VFGRKEMENEMEIISGGQEFLDRIEPLWEELNKHHMKKSIHFSELIKSRNFEARKKDLVSKSNHLRTDIAIDIKEKIDIGYCISTINDKHIGEIDSLYIKEPYRRNGIGKKLMEMTLTWLDDHAVIEKVLSVGSGNDEVIKFYEIFGFYTATINLMQKR